MVFKLQLSVLSEKFTVSRSQSIRLCEGLAVDDYNLQAMPETSPLKWHLAHTSWFYETFLLKPFFPDYQVFNEYYETLFNSYYMGVGQPYLRAQRALLSRPDVNEILDYLSHINDKILELLSLQQHPEIEQIQQRIRLGIEHEKQHQELMLTDLKYCFFHNPLYPVYCNQPLSASVEEPMHWLPFNAELYVAGYQGDDFCFDNELPLHKVYLADYEIASRPVTNGEYLAFIRDKGYRCAGLWLSDGWAWCQQQQLTHPLYWVQQGDEWLEYTLYGLKPIDLNAPACHLSFYEADAFARWAGYRLPSEYEWERSCAANSSALFSNEIRHPAINEIHSSKQPLAYVGQVWEWTVSSYAPYPGYQASKDTIGEYNGKFMCNQMVLKGGSCLSADEHLRSSYRNFFYPPDRWQMSGIRLARTL